jgi:hypothetical protein
MGNETARTRDARITVNDCALSGEPPSTLDIEVEFPGDLMKQHYVVINFWFFGFTSSHRAVRVHVAADRVDPKAVLWPSISLSWGSLDNSCVVVLHY